MTTALLTHVLTTIRQRLRWLRTELAPVGYWIRPYDVVADRRRWRWQPPARCGHAVFTDLDPAAQAQLADAVERLAARRRRSDYL